jgi:hypothetical protein
MNHRAIRSMGVALSLCLAATTARAEEPATQPAKSTTKVPDGMVGEWFEGSISPTNYYDSQTGKHLGNARKMGSILKVHANGAFEKYVYIYMRTYNVETEVWTTTKGNLSFKKNRIALTPTSGHYKTGGSSSNKQDRDMTPEELEKNKATYTWHFEKDKETGRTYLVMPFDDGSAFRYRRLDEEETAKK